MLGILQGCLQIAALWKRKKGNITANRLLAGYICIIVITLSGRFFYTYRPDGLLYYKILFAGDLIIFLYGPLLYRYFSALFYPELQTPKYFFLHFLPVMLFVASILPIIAAGEPAIRGLLISYGTVFHFIEAAAILQNLMYLILNYSLLQKFIRSTGEENSFLPQTHFYSAVLLLTLVALIGWLLSFIFRFIYIDALSDYFGYHIVWFSLSFVVIALGYYTLKYPEILTGITPSEDKTETAPLPLENISALSNKVLEVMENQKPYLQPKLTLSQLAQLTDMSPHLLSRVINEKFDKNFFEFINSYRIEAFKSLAANKDYSHMTLLALAFEAGFNSKTTFNTAFRKITGETPREFYSKTVQSA